MLSLDSVTNYDLLSADERLLFLEKATELLEERKVDEALCMCKKIPLSPLMVRYLTFLHGESYISEQGYMIREELTNKASLPCKTKHTV